MIRKQSTTNPGSDQVSVRLSDAAHRNMNQKYIFLTSLVKFPETIAPKTRPG